MILNNIWSIRETINVISYFLDLSKHYSLYSWHGWPWQDWIFYRLDFLDYEWKGYVNTTFEPSVIVSDIERMFSLKECADFKNWNVWGINDLTSYGPGDGQGNWLLRKCSAFISSNAWFMVFAPNGPLPWLILATQLLWKRKKEIHDLLDIWGFERYFCFCSWWILSHCCSLFKDVVPGLGTVHAEEWFRPKCYKAVSHSIFSGLKAL